MTSPTSPDDLIWEYTGRQDAGDHTAHRWRAVNVVHKDCPTGPGDVIRKELRDITGTVTDRWFFCSGCGVSL